MNYLLRTVAVCLLALLLPVLFLAQGPSFTTGQWAQDRSLHVARADACTVTLADGRMLATGGQGAQGALTSAEYLSVAGDFSAVAPMSVARSEHVCAPLPNGRVLAAGGRVSGNAATNAAEIYDPSSNTWTNISSMREARIGAAVAVLADGRVLIAGGEASGTASATLELFDPATQSFNWVAGAMSAPRKDSAASRLADGRVLIAGGSSGSGALATAEVFDPGTGAVHAAGSMSVARAGLSATLLDNGNVLLAGGSNGAAQELASSELFDPKTGAFSSGPSMASPRRGHLAFRIPFNNNVLIAGGMAAGQPVASTEQFAWWNSAFSPLGSISAARSLMTGGAGPTGLVTVAGGSLADGSASSNQDTIQLPTVKTDKLDYQPGDVAIITGSGWKPNETVNLLITETPDLDNDSPLHFTATADGAGNFTNTDLDIDEADLGTTFTLVATGGTSGMSAEVTFTDSRTINSVTLNGGSTVTVAPNASITAVVNVTTVNSNGNQKWDSTGWLISTTAPGTVTCVNHANHDLDGTYTETFTITAPAGTGVYNAYFIAYADDTCTASQPSNTFTLTNGVTVTPSTIPTTTTVASSLNPSTYGTAINFTSTVMRTTGTGAPTGSVQFKIDGVNFGGQITVAASGSNTATASSPSIATLAVGTHTVQADYIPTGTFGPSGGTVSGGQVVSKAPLTVTADDKTRIYGDANPSFTASYSGFKNGETLATSGVTGSPSLTTAATPTSSVGGSPYTITATVGSLSATNYSFTFVNGNLAVTKAQLTVTADDKSRGYGDADPTFTASYSGFKNSETLATSGVTGSPSLTTAATATSPVSGSPYTITAALGTLAAVNYDFTFVNGKLTVTKAHLTVTGDDKSRVYGDANPTFTATLSGFKNSETLGASGVSGSAACTTTAVTNSPVPGPYPINCTAGTLAAANYDFTSFVDGHLTITTRPVTATADAKTKVYGDADPALTYQITSGSLVSGDSFTGALTRVAGENVGPYAINQGTLELTSNYALTFVSANLTVTARPVTVTADAKTKVYGDADPALTYQTTSGSLAFTDTFTGALTRASGENVGTYAINQGTLALTTNYTLSYVSANLSITPRPVTVTADAKTKIYGEADPAFTHQTTAGNVIGTDTFSGALTRVAGENVGTYAIEKGTLSLGTNYTLTFVSANLTITTRPVTVTAEAKNKTYGDADPTLTYQITTGTTAFSDTFSGSLSRNPGENVGTWAIIQGTLTLGTNYHLTFVGANLTINARPIGVTAYPKTKVYGDADPTLTYHITSGSLAFSDTFSGTLTRAAGESVGTYAITQGTLALSTNYTLSFTGANLTITQRPITATADAKTKIYGEADPALTYQITTGNLVFGDVFSGSLSRAAGENVGAYAIQQGSLALTANYALTYVGANLQITPRPVTVTAAAKTKVYGEADPAFTYMLTSGTLVVGDSFTGALSRTAGENVGTYGITQGSLTLGGNYAITFVSANLSITSRPISVKADAQTKIYGDADPTLTYQITSGSLAFSDAFSGVLARAAGESVGTYAIGQGALTAGGNYTLTFVGASLSITVRPITVTAAAKTKTYGDPDPALTYQITSGSLVFGDVFSGALTRAAGENIGSYAITQGTLALSNNYALTFIGANFTITTRPITVTADPKTKVYGYADPAFTHQITSGSLVAGDSFSGAVSRVSGENVGPYAIMQGTLTLSANYALTYVPANLTITPRPVTVTAEAATKVYGNSDPVFAYHISAGTVVSGDTFSGSLGRAAGENVGIYAMTLETLTLGNNYSITFASANFSITARPIAVTADARTKVYGNADPALTYQITGGGSLAFGDAFSGALTRAAGESVGTYAIAQGTLALSSNYTLSFTGAQLTITARPVTVKADAQTKVYGNVDPALTYQITYGSLAFSDAFSGSLTRVAGESVGAYAITQSTLALSTNYALTYVGANLSITARPVTITAAPKTKVYGDLDPALTYQLTNGTLVGSDSFSGALTRASGESVGPYAIGQGTVTLGTNYSITFISADLTISQRPITVTADAKSKVYGNIDPTFTYQITSGNLAFSDAFSGSLGRTVGENIGTYAITPGSLTLGGNYNLSFVSANLTITVRAISVTADGKTKVYGDGDPALTYQFTNGPLPFSDAFSGALARASGENVGSYAISQGTLALSNNYTLTFTGASLTITKAVLTVTGDSKARPFGFANPALTATITGFKFGQTLATSGVTGSPSLVTSAALTSAPGSYPITTTVGTLASSNYSFTFFNGALQISKNGTIVSIVTVSPEPSNEGQPYVVSVLVTPAAGGAGPATGSVMVDDGSGASCVVTLSGGGGSCTLTSVQNGAKTLTATYGGDPNFFGNVTSTSHTVANVAPAVSAIAGPIEPIAVGSPQTTVGVTASFADPGAADSHTCTFVWDDATANNTVTAAGTGNGSCTATHTYSDLGVYTVGVTVKDNDGATTASNFQFVVLYDTAGGFVTGGGWIMSQPGAYKADATLTGKANFGFVSKYQKGASVPTGDTEFQFKTGNLNFKSTSYDWLVVSGSKAQYKGNGTINGSGNYSFILTAIEGSGTNPDSFRLKIQTAGGGVVYDSAVSGPDDIDNSPTTVLGGGSIQIHK